MAAPTQEEIRLRAYELWLAAGSPEGSGDAFWHQAEKELTEKNAAEGEVPPGMTQNFAGLKHHAALKIVLKQGSEAR